MGDRAWGTLAAVATIALVVACATLACLAAGGTAVVVMRRLI